MRGVTVTLVQGQRTWTLGTIDANDDFEFRLRATIPPDIQAGPAIIQASGAHDTIQFDVIQRR